MCPICSCAAARAASHWRQEDSLVAEATTSFGDASMAREVPPCNDVKQLRPLRKHLLGCFQKFLDLTSGI